MGKSLASANIHVKYIRRAAFYPFALCMLIAGWMVTPRVAAQEATASQDRRADGRGNRPRTMVPHMPPSNVTNNAAGGVITTGNQIEYNGGAVLLGTTNVYYIWYGNWDSSSIGILTNLASHIGGSPYFNINTGYFDGMGRSVSNSVSLAASTQDNYSRGTNLSDSDIWLIVSSALSSGRLPIDPNGAYFVLTAGNVRAPGFPSSLCGWHSEQAFNNTKIHYAFVGNPDPAGLSGCAQQTTSPNGNAGADAMASTVAHELDEIVTDPNLDAWYDSNGNEVADKCSWTFGATYTAINGSKANMRLGAKDYLIQQDWVNASGGYCALSYSPAPDFALSATVDSQAVIAGGTTGSYAVTIIPV